MKVAYLARLMIHGHKCPKSHYFTSLALNINIDSSLQTATQIMFYYSLNEIIRDQLVKAVTGRRGRVIAGS